MEVAYPTDAWTLTTAAVLGAWTLVSVIVAALRR